MNARLCGIRSYRPSNLVHSFGQMTATRTYSVPGQNQAMVGFAEVTEDEYECQRSCQVKRQHSLIRRKGKGGRGSNPSLFEIQEGKLDVGDM